MTYSTKFKLTLCLTIISALCLTANIGCRHNANMNNPKVVAAVSINDGAKACQTVATGLQDADKVLDALQATEPDYYAHVKPLLVKIATANDKAIAVVNAALAGDNSADWKAALIAVAAEIGTEDLRNFGFKNPKSQDAARLGFATLQGILLSIPATFGGK